MKSKMIIEMKVDDKKWLGTIIKAKDEIFVEKSFSISKTRCNFAAKDNLSKNHSCCVEMNFSFL